MQQVLSKGRFGLRKPEPPKVYDLDTDNDPSVTEEIEKDNQTAQADTEEAPQVTLNLKRKHLLLALI